MKVEIVDHSTPKKPIVEKSGDMFLFGGELRFVGVMAGEVNVFDQNGSLVNQFGNLTSANTYYSNFTNAPVKRIEKIILEVE